MMKKMTVVVTLVSSLLAGGSSLADPAQEEAVRNGREHFKIFCVNCHGINADGKGEVAESLNLMPSDLTALAQTGGDICVAERVLKAVAGVHEVAAGQQQNMPTFSGNLEGITIYELTQYLKSIQK